MLIKRSFSLSGHRTSVALEPEFGAVLEQLAAAGAHTLAATVAQLDSARTPADPLASRLRVAALVFALTLQQPKSGNPADG